MFHTGFGIHSDGICHALNTDGVVTTQGLSLIHILEQKQFPGTMTVSFEGAAKPVTSVFELSRLSTNKDWEAHTEVPGKYERIELQDLLKHGFLLTLT